ncbi:UNKNOWN [Stylonychia lemnae]|uniref:Uncharacterized protein n=1 Tax=Stylonychia lemnae TaxID=5949 RepID=A0A078B2I1_STYLE|nr:UNKNOWN [Stylonychia lemnae]|eukprot:CDW87427.1 UNKNOWN [Stylonychia lemnae]
MNTRNNRGNVKSLAIEYRQNVNNLFHQDKQQYNPHLLKNIYKSINDQQVIEAKPIPIQQYVFQYNNSQGSNSQNQSPKLSPERKQQDLNIYRSCLIDKNKSDIGIHVKKQFLRNDFLGNDYNELLQKSVNSNDPYKETDVQSGGGSITNTLPNQFKTITLNETSNQSSQKSLIFNNPYVNQLADTNRYYQQEIISRYKQPNTRIHSLDQSKNLDIPNTLQQRNQQQIQEFLQNQDNGYVGQDHMLRSKFNNRKLSNYAAQNMLSSSVNERLSQNEDSIIQNLYKTPEIINKYQNRFDLLFKHQPSPERQMNEAGSDIIKILPQVSQSLDFGNLRNRQQDDFKTFIPLDISQDSSTIQQQQLQSQIQQSIFDNYKNRQSHIKLVSQQRRRKINVSEIQDRYLNKLVEKPRRIIPKFEKLPFLEKDFKYGGPVNLPTSQDYGQFHL